MMELTVKLTALTVNNENLVKEIQQKESELLRKDHELQQIQQVHTNTGTHLLTYSLTHLLTHSPTHSLTYSLTHLLTHSLT
jgi:hypothetical protein